ncbi:MAG: glutamate--cysteine ligase [Gammaproteobacteria bacterium]|nr:glutamate--cysteine ligase [Gammaproteobacteria bacterium]MCY4277912.1 glutamate--cysteine ligase [Gammaproteobacteria bacterium]MCY4322493.1 glutamate--cysteine ligase [Gammaproteobacteria bacterium]
MGEEIRTRSFAEEDFAVFAERLREETELLRYLFENRGLSQREHVAGFELEAWLVDQEGRARPDNAVFLKRLKHGLVVPELAKFNVEINGSPTSLQGKAFSRLNDELLATWTKCVNCARMLGAHVLQIGILPTIQVEDLHTDNMSGMTRFAALNDQVLERRGGAPFQIDIRGEARLRRTHPNVLLEAAATSFQVHLQVKPESAAALYNASLLASAACVGAATNSPMFLGKQLWMETRIPVFEQSVDVGADDFKHVTFGSGYVRDSLFEVFAENLASYQPLIPQVDDAAPSRFAHLRLHNGTVWRWNRPLVGFDYDGTPHLRLEHRVIPAGPSLIDNIANAAFFYGLVLNFAEEIDALGEEIPFAEARRNFYRAARHGTDAQVRWRGGEVTRLKDLLLRELLPRARLGLLSENIPESEVHEFLHIVARRVEQDQTGAHWMRSWLGEHGDDHHGLVLAYLDRQTDGAPVHEWSV